MAFEIEFTRNAAAQVPELSAHSETVSLSMNPKFIALIEESRAQYKVEGGIPASELRRQLSIVPKSKGRTSTRAKVDAHLIDTIKSGPARKRDREARDRIRTEGLKRSAKSSASRRKIK